MQHFVAAASISTLSKFASARIGAGAKAAPTRKGFNPTSSTPLRDSDVLRQRQQYQQDQQYYNRPGTQSMYETLKAALTEEDEASYLTLRNSNNITQQHQRDTYVDDDEHIDIGMLDSNRSTKSPTESPTLNTVTSTCMIAYSDEDFVPDEDFLPASTYLQNQFDGEDGTFYWNVLFDLATNTITCNERNMDEENSFGCSRMSFKGCSVVKCNGKESCAHTIIEDADTIECGGYESCAHADLDATTIDCAGDRACYGAIIGDRDRMVSTLDCHTGESTCAYAKTYSVGDVFCTGPHACYGAELMGVESTVTCQGVDHSDGYYTPTCGGDSGLIEAADDHNIDVICTGDFSCIGYGHNAYDRKEHPVYFDIDVGRNGSLTCEGSPGGNHDSFTYVCLYIDIIQGCDNYDCMEPSYFVDDGEFPTCNHIFSVHHHDMCSDDNNDDDDDDDDNNDHDDDDDDSLF